MSKEALLKETLENKLRLVDKASRSIIEEVPVLQNVNFSPLLKHPTNWPEQTKIKEDYVQLMNAAFVHYNGDVGLVLCFLAGEYTAEWRDADKVVRASHPCVSPEDCEHIHRILTKDCPLEFSWEESAENKEAYLCQGNCRSVTMHWPGVFKTLVKEVRNRRLMTFSGWTIRASPYCHTVPQTTNDKGGKICLCWNGSGKRWPWQISMNEKTSRQGEPDITFGFAFMAFCI